MIIDNIIWIILIYYYNSRLESQCRLEIIDSIIDIIYIPLLYNRWEVEYMTSF